MSGVAARPPSVTGNKVARHVKRVSGECRTWQGGDRVIGGGLGGPSSCLSVWLTMHLGLQRWRDSGDGSLGSGCGGERRAPSLRRRPLRSRLRPRIFLVGEERGVVGGVVAELRCGGASRSSACMSSVAAWCGSWRATFLGRSPWPPEFSTAGMAVWWLGGGVECTRPLCKGEAASSVACQSSCRRWPSSQ